jgi:Fe-S cluster assembly protein SufD
MAQNLIRMGAGSKAQILESYLGLGGTPYFYNGYTQILCEENSHLEFVRVSQHGENSVADHGLVAECGSDSSLSHFELSLGEGLVRNEVQISLTDQGCDLSSYGAYLVGGRAHVDNHTYIAHLAPNSQSRQLYKGIVQDQGRAVFDGRVFIERGADGTNASQLNRNLLLSDLAEVDAKPNLEIYADDVKATHGATIGRLSDEEMFYLQSRGIDKAQAKKILCQGFIEDVVYKIKSEVIRELVAQILKPIVHKMEGSWQ